MAASTYVFSRLLTFRWPLSGWLLLFFLLCRSVVAQTTVEKNVQQQINRADAERDLTKAEAFYTDALRQLPNADAALIGRAIVRGRLGRYREGIADATAAIALIDTAARYYAQRGYLRVQVKEYDLAALDYERAVQLKPREATYYSGLSYCRVKQTRLAEALKAAQTGIDLNPNSPYAYRNRGRAKLLSGKIDEAIADFQRSLERQHGESYRVLTDLGEAYEIKKNYTLAADYYAKALALKPGYPDAEARQQGIQRETNPTNKSGATGSTFIGKRVAFVVGNSEYINVGAPLREQPVHDAQDITTRLRELGFTTTLVTNAENKTMRDKLNAFYDAAADADLVFFYFAGHGLQYKGANYLLPTDIDVHPTDPKRYDDELAHQAFLVTTLIEQIQNQKPRFCLVVLDACREDPLKNSKTVPLADANAHFLPPPFSPIVIENLIRNCCVAQATTAGKLAWNGSGRNGCYTDALLRYLKKGSALEPMLKNVRNYVLETSQKAGELQRPEYLNQTTDDLIF